jgi:hypothetical protein
MILVKQLCRVDPEGGPYRLFADGENGELILVQVRWLDGWIMGDMTGLSWLS